MPTSGIPYRVSATDKYEHDYVRWYERLSPRRAVCELGVQYGESIKLWRSLWPHAKVVGVDKALKGSSPDFHLVSGDCRDEETWSRIRPYGPFDLVVDDASHISGDMIQAIERGWDTVAPGGVWVIEDTCCTFWPEYVTADFWPWVSARLADLHWQGERGHGEWRDRRYYAREPRNIWEETLDRIEVINSMVWFCKRR